MLAADSLSETIGIRADGDKTDLRALVRSMISAGLAPILIKPGSKEPFCPLPDVTRKRADAAARTAAQAAGQRRWERAAHACGKYHTMTDSKTAKKYLDFAAKVYGEDTCNLALHVGRSRMVCVDADQASEVAAFTGFWHSLTGEMAGVPPTVWSPGKVDQATGVWSHSGGGHFWMTIPEGCELPTRMGTWTSPHGWVAYWGDAYVLVPPSVRDEGPYRWTGTGVPVLPAWLHTLIWGPELAWRERAAARGTARAEGTEDWSRVDSWAAATSWAEILEPDGWELSGRISTCGCDEWTAPGDHGSPKSATAHDLGCGQFDDSPGHNPLHIWTDSPPDFLIDAPKTVTKLQYVAWRDHGGDVGPAMGALGIGSSGPALVPLGIDTSLPTAGEEVTGVQVGNLIVGPAEVWKTSSEVSEANELTTRDEQVPTPQQPLAALPPLSPLPQAAGTMPDMPPLMPLLTQPNPVWNPPGNLGLAPMNLVPPIPASAAPSPAVRIPAQGTRLPAEFWAQRPLLGHIHAEAKAVMLSADAVLHGVLAHASAMIPHTVQAKTKFGTSSLSIFTALCGRSGTGKSSAQRLAARLLGDRSLIPYPTPTAEGMAESLMGTVDEEYPDPDDDTKVKKRKVRRQTRHNAMFYVDEAQDLGRQFERKEASIGGALRSAWSGAAIGSMNASEDRRRLIRPDSYHIGMIVSAQPQSLGFLVGERDLGTAQRFLFAEAHDPDAVDDESDHEFRPLSWTPPRASGNVTVIGAEDELPGGFTLRAPREVDRECAARRMASARGEADDMDSQWSVTLLKIAGVLAYLDGRTWISGQDWELARCVYDTSTAVRESMGELIEQREVELRREEAGHAASRSVAIKREVDNAAAVENTYADKLAKAVTEAGRPLSSGYLKRLVDPRRRDRLDDFLAAAVQRGLVYPAGTGRQGAQLWRGATPEELAALAAQPG